MRRIAEILRTQGGGQGALAGEGVASLAKLTQKGIVNPANLPLMIQLKVMIPIVFCASFVP